MAKSAYRKVTRTGSKGRFVVSEGIAPSAYLLGHPGLPTFQSGFEEDPRLEVIIPQGTIISAVAGVDGSTYVVPANGTASAFTWGDAGVVNPDTGATPNTGAGGTDTIQVPARSVPIGCTQADVYRPFDKNNSFAASWITTGYVEWPIVDGINADLAVGDLVRADHMGRPVKATTAQLFDSNNVYSHLAVGKVVEIEKFATNFDDGLLSYMQLPSDPGALKDVYSITKAGPYLDKFGVRKNLDVVNSLGAVRVVLTLT